MAGADRRHLRAPPGYDLVRIRLVAHVPHELVARRFEDAVQRDGQLDRAQIGAEVSTLVRRNHVDNALPHLVDEIRKPLRRKGAQLRGRGDLVEEGHGDNSFERSGRTSDGVLRGTSHEQCTGVGAAFQPAAALSYPCRAAT